MSRVLVRTLKIANTRTSSEMFYGPVDPMVVVHENAISEIHTSGALFVRTEKETIVYAPGAWEWTKVEREENK